MCHQQTQQETFLLPGASAALLRLLMSATKHWLLHVVGAEESVGLQLGQVALRPSGGVSEMLQFVSCFNKLIIVITRSG